MDTNTDLHNMLYPSASNIDEKTLNKYWFYEKICLGISCVALPLIYILNIVFVNIFSNFKISNDYLYFIPYILVFAVQIISLVLASKYARKRKKFASESQKVDIANKNVNLAFSIGLTICMLSVLEFLWSIFNLITNSSEHVSFEIFIVAYFFAVVVWACPTILSIILLLISRKRKTNNSKFKATIAMIALSFVMLICSFLI